MLIAYIHFLSTVFMLGLIWFVQIVHYPLFEKVEITRSSEYQAEHQKRTSWVVGAPMAVEALTAIWLLIDPTDSRLLPLIGLLILIKVQLSTVLLQVPAHSNLLDGYTSEKISSLVRSNWIRTAGWTSRSVIATLIVANGQL